MASGPSFPFTSSALRAFRSQELEEQRWALRQRRVPSVSSRVRQQQQQQQQQQKQQQQQNKQRQQAATETARTPWRASQEERLVCRDVVVHHALFAGDLALVRRIFREPLAANVIVQCPGDPQVTTGPRASWMWPCPSQLVLTTPARIAASRGYTDCLEHLLQRGANPDANPGGDAALHAACETAQDACARLLLEFGANPSACSERGLTPLHHCTSPGSLACARLLLEFSADVNAQSEDDEEGDTPLHVAARHALLEHARLYLARGAHPDDVNARGLTPLMLVCMHPGVPGDPGARVLAEMARALVAAGARVDARDPDLLTPLHGACRGAHAALARVLVECGARVNALDYNGVAPLQKVLQVAAYRREHNPEVVVQDLLNRGSVKVWPGAFHRVLESCSEAANTVEVLLNVYGRIKITPAWRQAIPDDTYQRHAAFYDSVFALQGAPRALQHLARCALRSYLDARCAEVVPQLPLPPRLQSYLLLEPMGYVH
ncbi:ankyrin repeat and SOCS box protein 18-like isoform X2 [Lethenteron reissneri]|uniref:ankyrin repeat and SOCS box protein 18-like isoform X2 n=1 Tax=Lethenteron reissneri TaxID=7753 RepID=UPI002AB67ABE|nr:ankyrin repeat and SOCS box protein 18-like isoform X2 [Lethenteron reissneri]